MTSEETTFTSTEAFNDALKLLLRRAYNDDIDVEGGWECRNGTEHPDWDVVITEVTKNGDSE